MRLKLIIEGIIKFFQSISLLVLTFGIVLLMTVFNQKYIENNLEKDNYYDKLYDSIRLEMSDYLVQSGLNEDVLDNIYSRNNIKNETTKLFNKIYHNKPFTIETLSITEKLNSNISKYLEQNNIEIDDEDSLNKFVGQMTNIYKDSVGYSNIIDKYGSSFYKIYTCIKIITIISGILLVVSYILSKILFKKMDFSIPLFTSSILLFLFYFYVESGININNFTFYTTEVTNLIRIIFNHIFSAFLYLGIGYFGLGIVCSFLGSKNKKIKENSKVKIFILLAWLLVIFNFSAQSAVSSTKTSSDVTRFAVGIVNVITVNSIDDKKTEDIVEKCFVVVRKSAHFIEFLILGLLVISVLKDYFKKDKWLIIMCIMLCFLYACTDEFHQYFVPHRSASIIDVLIDTSGSTVGIMLYITCHNILKKRKKKKHSHKIK